MAPLDLTARSRDQNITLITAESDSTDLSAASLHESLHSDTPDRHTVNLPNDYARSVHHIVEAWANNAPDTIAVVRDDQHVTYSELNRRANQLAAYLRTCNIGHEALIGLCLERSADLIIGALGVLKAGGAYVPLDPSYPPDRLAFMLEDCRARYVLTHERYRAQLPSGRTPVFSFDTDWPILPPGWRTTSEDNTTGDSLAYVIYTSGSTGRPKGVAIAHRGLLNLIAWHRRESKIISQDRATLIASPGFDASAFEIWGHLAAGASLHIPNEHFRATPVHLHNWLFQRAITVSFLPTPLAELIMKLPWPSMTALRVLHTGGDVLRQYPDTMAPFALINNYGPTEATIITTSGRVPVASASNTLPTIGRPIDNTYVYLLDPTLQPVAPGRPGELYIGGVGLARGYLFQPAQTAERFIPNPFSLEPGARLYRTGDLACRLPDGTIAFLDRVDQQVKLRGFRIELGEIEAALMQYPAIQAAAVLMREDQSGDRRLVAYVVAAHDPPPDDMELRRYLRARFPEYMIPSVFGLINALPLTPNGKIDRAVLASLSIEMLIQSGTTQAARTSTEDLVLAVWRSILGVERIGIHNHFYDLGGHSLLVAQMASRIRQLAGFDIPLQTFFEQLTVARLARWLDCAQSQGEVLSRRAPTTSYPEPSLSSVQQRLWFIDQFVPERALYNTSIVFHIQGALDLAVLARCLSEIIRRHEVLRTAFIVQSGQPQMRIAPPFPMLISSADLCALPEVVAAEQRQRMFGALARQPFDLRHVPLLRALLLRLEDQRFQLLLTLHHIIFDGWSIAVLLRELEALYPAFAGGRASPLPELPIQYSAVAAWQHDDLYSGSRAALLAYWKAQFADQIPILALPADRPRPPVQTFPGAIQTRTLPPSAIARLEHVGRCEDATLFMVMLAAFVTLLYRYSNQTDLIVGTAVAERPTAMVEDLIGFFVNTLPLRCNLSNTPSFRVLIERVRQVALGAYAHQSLPLDQIIEALDLERDHSRHPLFQVMLVVQNAPIHTLRLPDLRIRFAEELRIDLARFELTMILEFPERGPAVTLEYNTDLFEHTTISRMLNHFLTLLDAAVVAPDARIDDLPLLTLDERQQIIYDWNDTRCGLPEEIGIHVLVEAQARRTPDRIALVFGDMHLTYQALNQRANQLAHALRALGVGSELPVGLCMDRSLAVVTGLLGIFKAGGVAIAMDSAYPDERLAFMIADAQPLILLSQESLLERLVALAPPEASRRPSVICIDRDWPTIARANSTDPVVRLSCDNLAYIIYTSGSTGQPRGVMVEHRALYNLTLAKIQGFAIRSDSHVLQFVSFGFDVAISDVFMTLSVGARLCLRPQEILSGAELARLLHDQAISVIVMPASALAAVPPQNLPALRSVVAGGEACSTELVACWAPGRRFTNAYGPTEATICTTMARCQDGLRPPTIGRPIANVQVYLLDSRLRPVPIGVVGELYIGGLGLSRGYLNRPDLTAERFLPNSFAQESEVRSQESEADRRPPTNERASLSLGTRHSALGTRLYRTGDLARYQPDGAIMLLGRTDDQVKLRGFRVELGEIAAALTQHQAVCEAVVMVYEQRLREQQLVAYLIANPGAIPAANDMRRFLRARLPEYMIPSSFIVLDAFPRTGSGKIDRRALPPPDYGHSVEGYDPVAPRTFTEEILAEIWREVLGIAQIGVEDDFFDRGGQSLLAAQVMARVRERFEIDLRVRTLFDAPTIAALALRIEQAMIDDIGTLDDEEVERLLDIDMAPDDARV